MKTIEWRGPEIPGDGGFTQYGYESLSESMERLHWEKHAKFQRWQAAITMNMIFGDNYVTVPEIPKGYEAYAKQCYDNMKPVR